MTHLSQTARFGDILTPEGQYRQDCVTYTLDGLTREQEDALAERAREGDAQAKHDLLMSLLGYVQYWASRYARAYRGISVCVDYLELVACGNLSLVEKLETALTRDQPWPYLAKVARYEMLDLCFHFTRDKGIESLDASYGDDGRETLADMVPDPAFDAEIALSYFDYVGVSQDVLYREVEKLTPKQRLVLTHHYGLYGQKPQPLTEVCQNLLGRAVTHQTAQEIKESGLQTLCRRLNSPLPESYTIAQACQVLNVSEYRLYAILHEKKVTRVEKGCYVKQEIDALASSRRKGAWARGKPQTRTPHSVVAINGQEVYTQAQACELLGVNKQGFYYLSRKYQITRLAKGCYPKHEIDTLVAERTRYLNQHLEQEVYA